MPPAEMRYEDLVTLGPELRVPGDDFIEGGDHDLRSRRYNYKNA